MGGSFGRGGTVSFDTSPGMSVKGAYLFPAHAPGTPASPSLISWRNVSTATKAAQRNPAAKMGYIKKQSQSRRSWNKRYLVVEQGTVTFYERRNQDGGMGGIAALEGLGSLIASVNGRRHSLSPDVPRPNDDGLGTPKGRGLKGELLLQADMVVEEVRGVIYIPLCICTCGYISRYK